MGRIVWLDCRSGSLSSRKPKNADLDCVIPMFVPDVLSIVVADRDGRPALVFIFRETDEAEELFERAENGEEITFEEAIAVAAVDEDVVVNEYGL